MELKLSSENFEKEVLNSEKPVLAENRMVTDKRIVHTLYNFF